MIKVSGAVSSIRNQGADCILPKEEFDQKQFKEKGLGRFFVKVSETSPEKGVDEEVKEESKSVQKPRTSIELIKADKEEHKTAKAEKKSQEAFLVEKRRKTQPQKKPKPKMPQVKGQSQLNFGSAANK